MFGMKRTNALSRRWPEEIAMSSATYESSCGCRLSIGFLREEISRTESYRRHKSSKPIKERPDAPTSSVPMPYTTVVWSDLRVRLVGISAMEVLPPGIPAREHDKTKGRLTNFCLASTKVKSLGFVRPSQMHGMYVHYSLLFIF